MNTFLISYDLHDKKDSAALSAHLTTLDAKEITESAYAVNVEESSESLKEGILAVTKNISLAILPLAMSSFSSHNLEDTSAKFWLDIALHQRT